MREKEGEGRLQIVKERERQKSKEWELKWIEERRQEVMGEIHLARALEGEAKGFALFSFVFAFGSLRLFGLFCFFPAW